MRTLIYSTVLVLGLSELTSAQNLTATQILGQQLGACATSQAELVERNARLQAEITELKAKLEDKK